MRKFTLIGIALLLLILASGCGQKPQAGPNANTPTDQPPAVDVDPGLASGNAESSGGGQDNTQMSEEPQWKTASIQVYVTDDNIADLVAVKRDIKFIEERDKYAEAFKELQRAENGQVSLWEKTVLNKAVLENGLLSVDIQLPDEARLGSGGEALAIESLRNTMFQFEEVELLDLTVDGVQVDTLMGHVELEHPMERLTNS